MIFKTLKHSVCIILILIYDSSAGVIAVDGKNEHSEHVEVKKFEPEHKEVATSYMNFHGPVEGPEFEVKVPYIEKHEDHGHHDHKHEDHHEPEVKYRHDYVGHPKYEFSYGVEDHHTGDFHSQKETRDGSTVTGEYSIAEPGGRLRIVSYHADKDGFHAEVHTSGKTDHSGYHNQQQHQYFVPIHVAQAKSYDLQGHHSLVAPQHYQQVQHVQQNSGWSHDQGYGGWNGNGGWKGQNGGNGWKGQYGGWKDQNGGWKDQSGGWKDQYGGWKDQNGGWKDQYGGWKDQNGGWKGQYGGWKGQYGGWK